MVNEFSNDRGVAQFERTLIGEHVRAGLAGARAKGTTLGLTCVAKTDED